LASGGFLISSSRHGGLTEYIVDVNKHR